MESSEKLNQNTLTKPKRIRLRFLFPFLLGALVWSAGCSSFSIDKTLKIKKPKPSDSYTRGIAYYLEGFFESAVIELKNVPADHPNFLRAKKYLQRAEKRVEHVQTHEKAALNFRGKKQLLDALNEVEKALKAYPKNRRIHRLFADLNQDIETEFNQNFRKGRENFNQESYEKAKIAFRKAQQFKPEHKPTLEYLFKTENRLLERYQYEGRVLLKNGDLDSALESFELAHKMKPGHPGIKAQLVNTYNSRALKNYREEKLNEAVDDLQRSLEINSHQESIKKQLQQIEKRILQLKKITP